MARRKHREALAWLELTELATTAPLVAAERLRRVSSMSADMAWREWSHWATEKMFAWQLVGPRLWAAALTGKHPTMAATMRALEPVSTRVRSNARRRKR